MNAEKLFNLAMAVLFAATIIGCSDNGDDNSSSDQTTSPEIKKVFLHACTRNIYDELVCDPVHTSNANTRQEGVLKIWFSDRDTDLRTLYINHFHESDGFTTAVSTQSVQIPPKKTPDFQHVFIDDPFVVSAPTGFWKLRFLAVDEAGNESNEYEFDFLVNNSS
jgi:hypothetical protein